LANNEVTLLRPINVSVLKTGFSTNGEKSISI
jgi:hypothetical protein